MDDVAHGLGVAAKLRGDLIGTLLSIGAGKQYLTTSQGEGIRRAQSCLQSLALGVTQGRREDRFSHTMEDKLLPIILLGYALGTQHLLQASSQCSELADLPHPQQTRFAEHALNVLVSLFPNGQRRTTHRWGDGDAELVHRQLYGTNRRVAVPTEGHEGEDAPVQFCRPLEVVVPRGMYQVDEQFGGNVGEGAYGAVGSREQAGQDQVLPTREHREVGSHPLDLPQHAYGMAVLSYGIFQSSYVRALGGYPCNE